MASERLNLDEPSLRDRIRRTPGHPALAAALLIAVATDVVLVASNWSERRLPLARLILPPSGARMDPASGPGDYVIIDGSTGVHVVDSYHSADELSRAIQEHPEAVFQIWWMSHDHTGGLLAPWWHRRGGRYVLRCLDEKVTQPPASVASFARQFIVATYMPQDDGTASIFDDPPRTQTRLDWPGILHDLIMLPLAAVAIVNLFFVPAYLRRRRRERRLAQGLCPACRYSLAGLPAGAAACPECGQALAEPLAPPAPPP